MPRKCSYVKSFCRRTPSGRPSRKNPCQRDNAHGTFIKGHLRPKGCVSPQIMSSHAKIAAAFRKYKKSRKTKSRKRAREADGDGPASKKARASPMGRGLRKKRMSSRLDGYELPMKKRPRQSAKKP